MASRLENESVPQQAHWPRLVPLPEGPACVMAIGTAFPEATIEQSTYPDKLFAMCGVTDKDSLKAKFKYMCECEVSKFLSFGLNFEGVSYEYRYAVVCFSSF